MAYTNKEVFTLSSVSVILCECFYNLVCIFLDTFLVAKIMSLTNYSLLYIGLFYLVQYACQILLSILLNYLIKKIKLNFFVTIGSVIMIGLVMAVFFLGDELLVNFIPILAVFYSLGSSFFWTGQNNLATIAVSSRYQVRFFTVKKTSVIFIKALVPFVLGSSIEAMGFSIVAVIMAVFTILLFVFSLFIKPNKKFNMEFKFFGFTKKVIKERKNYKLLWTNYKLAFIYGMSITLIGVLFTFMVYKYTKNDFGLGTIKSIVTAISLIGMFVFLKYYRKRQAKWYTFIPMILVPASGIIMLIWTNIYTIITFFFVYNILSVNLTSLTDMRRAGVIRMLSMHEHVLEHNALFEVLLSISRVIGFGLFVLIGYFNYDWMFIALFAFVIVMFVLFCFYTYRTEQLLIEQDKEWKREHVIYSDKTMTH